MNGDLVSVLLWGFLAILTMFLAEIFGYVFYKDRDSRKLMFMLAFAFASLSYIPKMQTGWESIQIMENLWRWGSLPLVSAILIAVLSSLLKIEDFANLYTAFLFALATSIFVIVVPLPVNFLPSLIFQGISMIVIVVSIYLILTRRKISDFMFLLSILCFTLGGLGLAGDLAIEFNVFAFVFAYVFIALVFTTSEGSVKGGMASFFALKRELEKTQEERKRAKEALSKSEEKFRNIFESASDCMIFLDRSGRILDVNGKAVQVFGGSKKELLGKQFTRAGIFSPRDIPTLMTKFSKILANKNPTLNVCIKNKKGQEIPLECSTSLMKISDKLSGILVVARDVTERKKAEERIRASEERYRSLIELAPDSIMTFNMKGVITSCNTASTRMGGYSEDELIGKRFSKIGAIRARDVFKYLKMLNSVARGKVPKPFEVIYRRKNGTLGFGDTHISLIKERGKITGFQAIMRDITDRKRMEEALRQSEEKYRSLVENIPDVTWTLDREDNTIFVSSNVEKLFGFTPEEIYQAGNRFWNEKNHPDDRERVQKEYDSLFTRNKPFDVEYRIQRKDGHWIWIHDRAVETYKKDGVMYADGVLSDITERKQMEKKLEEYSEHLEELVEKRTRQLKKTQEQLLKSERLAAIGEVAAMVGHDLRNPLTGIAGATYYLKTKFSPKMDKKTKEMLELIEKDIEYSNNIISGLFEYSREIRLELTETTPKSIIKDALTLVKAPKNIRILDLTQNEPKIEIDLQKMKRVFVNIIKNAIDAMPKGGKLTITNKKSNDNLEIAFTDTGTGIPKDLLEKIWTPLFTTKAKGMGLGLSICKRIVETHGGSISVKSTAGKDTTFTVILPIKPKIKGGEKTWVNMPESLLLTTTKA